MECGMTGGCRRWNVEWNVYPGMTAKPPDTHECGKQEGEKTERGDEKTEKKPDAPLEEQSGKTDRRG